MIYMVLLSVDKFDRIDAAMHIKGVEYRSLGDFYKYIATHTRDGELQGDADILVYSLSDFLEAVNDEEVNDSLWWLTYITIKT